MTPELEVDVEAVVLMHELDHTIRILKVGWYGNYYRGFALYEIYDSADSTSQDITSMRTKATNAEAENTKSSR